MTDKRRSLVALFGDVSLSKVEVSYDFDEFRARMPYTFSNVFKEIHYENDFLIADPNNENSFYYVVAYDGYMLVFDIVDEHCFTSQESGWLWFKKEEQVLDLKNIRKIAASAEKMPQKEITNNKIFKAALISLKDLFNTKEKVSLTVPICEQLSNTNFFELLKKLMSVEKHKVLSQLKEAIDKARPNDMFYNDLKKTYEEAEERLNKAISEYLVEVKTFQNTLRNLEHLRLLTELKND